MPNWRVNLPCANVGSSKLQKKAALDFFNGYFKRVTEGRSDYDLIAQEVLGLKHIKTTKPDSLLTARNSSKCWGSLDLWSLLLEVSSVSSSRARAKASLKKAYG